MGQGIHAFIRESLATNLHNNHYNQTDASYGFAAVVAEAPLQSHGGEISLLPALPPDWCDGSVTGLRARGGFEVSIHWQGGALHSAQICNDHAATCKVRHGPKFAEFSCQPGQTLRLNAALTSAE